MEMGNVSKNKKTDQKAENSQRSSQDENPVKYRYVNNASRGSFQMAPNKKTCTSSVKIDNRLNS